MDEEGGPPREDKGSNTAFTQDGSHGAGGGVAGPGPCMRPPPPPPVLKDSGAGSATNKCP